MTTGPGDAALAALARRASCSCSTPAWVASSASTSRTGRARGGRGRPRLRARARPATATSRSSACRGSARRRSSVARRSPRTTTSSSAASASSTSAPADTVATLRVRLRHRGDLRRAGGARRALSDIGRLAQRRGRGLAAAEPSRFAGSARAHKRLTSQHGEQGPLSWRCWRHQPQVQPSRALTCRCRAPPEHAAGRTPLCVARSASPPHDALGFRPTVIAGAPSGVGTVLTSTKPADLSVSSACPSLSAVPP